MKQVFLSVLLLGFSALPVFAQAEQPYNSQFDSPVNRDTGTLTDDAGFDWRWLLPLLAIPIGYFIWKGAKTEQDRGVHYDDVRYVGAKGGEASRTDDDFEVVDEEDDKDIKT